MSGSYAHGLALIPYLFFAVSVLAINLVGDCLGATAKTNTYVYVAVAASDLPGLITAALNDPVCTGARH